MEVWSEAESSYLHGVLRAQHLGHSDTEFLNSRGLEPLRLIF